MKNPDQTQARNIAAKEQELEKKFSILRGGEMASWPETEDYELAWMNLKFRNCDGKFLMAIYARTRRAIMEGDDVFFERMAKLTRHRKGQPRKGWVDWLGAKVVEAATLLESDGKKATVDAITKMLNSKKFLGHETDPDREVHVRQVREVMKRVGLIQSRRKTARKGH